jgi:hypothetical protein
VQHLHNCKVKPYTRPGFLKVRGCVNGLLPQSFRCSELLWGRQWRLTQWLRKASVLNMYCRQPCNNQTFEQSSVKTVHSLYRHYVAQCQLYETRPMYGGFSLWSLGFNPTTPHVKVVVDEVTLHQVHLPVSSVFLCWSSCHHIMASAIRPGSIQSCLWYVSLGG